MSNSLNFEVFLKKQVREHIKGMRPLIRTILGPDARFDMSGYDSKVKGSCTLHNQEILNVFAKEGIYDYTEYLFLDFYKGIPRIYLKYWDDETQLDSGSSLIGWTTSEIIACILILTVHSGRRTRRRN